RNGTIVTEDSHDDADPALEASRAHARELSAQGIDVDAAVRLLQRAFAELKKG
ncbi:GntR family transcriptional regulator, partial [Brevibacterium paucivorans]